jgi:hypothetical protein
MSGEQVLKADVAIIGGGIAGLWTRAVLARAGFSVILIENRALGHGQTLCSQGILHRGVKYAFSDAARGASSQLADAASMWMACMRGDGPVNLRGVRVLSESTYMWTVGGILSNLTAWGASKALRSGVAELSREEMTGGFSGAPSNVKVWRVEEPVLDASDLVRRVAVSGDVDGGGVMILGSVEAMTDGESRAWVDLNVAGEEGRVTLRVQRVVCAAGAGNEKLLSMWPGADASVTQRRPLRMGMVFDVPFELFGHVPQGGSDKPRITITTGRVGDRSGERRVWYVGGNVAEQGVGQDGAAFEKVLRSELAACVPWADVSKSGVVSFLIDRAEGKTEAGTRPDGPVVRKFGNMLAVWPTKLALAPVAAEMVLREMLGMAGQKSQDDGRWLELVRPTIGKLPWERVS